MNFICVSLRRYLSPSFPTCLFLPKDRLTRDTVQKMLRRLITSSLAPAARNLSSTAQARVGIPFVIDNEGKGERTYDIYSRLLRDRIVCLMTPVNHLFLHFYFKI